MIDHSVSVDEEVPNVPPEFPIIALDVEVKPNSRGYLLFPGEYELRLILAASNCRPRKYAVKISSNGRWYDDRDTNVSNRVSAALRGPNVGDVLRRLTGNTPTL